MVQWFIVSLNHQFIDSVIHWIFASLIHWLIYPLIHWFIVSLFHWLIDSLVHWFIASLDHSISRARIRARILSCHCMFISTTICSFVDAPHNFNRSWFLHLKKRCYRPVISCSHLPFSKLPPRRVTSTIWYENGICMIHPSVGAHLLGNSSSDCL